MSVADAVVIEARDGGWLVSSGDAPIGFVTQTGQVMTPSGAEYTVGLDGADAAMASPEAGIVAEYAGGDDPRLTNAANGVVWELVPDWRTAVRGDERRTAFSLAEIFAVPYTLEDAQGTVPARVKLLLAWLVAKDWMKGGE